jgi:hypothetical protein
MLIFTVQMDTFERIAKPLGEGTLWPSPATCSLQGLSWPVMVCCCCVNSKLVSISLMCFHYCFLLAFMPRKARFWLF